MRSLSPSGRRVEPLIVIEAKNLSTLGRCGRYQHALLWYTERQHAGRETSRCPRVNRQKHATRIDDDVRAKYE